MGSWNVFPGRKGNECVFKWLAILQILNWTLNLCVQYFNSFYSACHMNLRVKVEVGCTTNFCHENKKEENFNLVQNPQTN